MPYVPYTTRTGTNGNDTIIGGAGHDSIFGAGGNDYLVTGLLESSLYGGAGHDTLVANNDFYNYLSGGTGNDQYFVRGPQHSVVETVNQGTDIVHLLGDHYVLPANVEHLYVENNNTVSPTSSATGNDLANYLQGNTKANWFDGGVGNDTVHGWQGNDTVIGGLGNDWLFGDQGDDVLWLQGNDTVWGDLQRAVPDVPAGADTFVISNHDHRYGVASSTIRDFQLGTDHLALDDGMTLMSVARNWNDNALLTVGDGYSTERVELVGVSYSAFTDWSSNHQDQLFVAAPSYFG